MSRLQARCPHCQVRMNLKNSSLIGKKVRCPGCKQPFTVRALGAPDASESCSHPGKAAADTDFLDADAVAADESATAAGDDWLDALDALTTTSSARSSAAAAGPPPVAGKRKKAPAASGRKSKRGLRDADGDLPLWLHRLLMVGTGLIAGGLATAIWAGLIYRTGFTSSYFALIVGTAIGGGVRLGASKWDFGWGPALTASIIAFVAVMGGKIIGVNVLMAEQREQAAQYTDNMVKLMSHENYLISREADAVWSEQIESGADVAWDADLDTAAFDDLGLETGDPSDAFDPEQLPESYPPQIWDAAEQRWQDLAPEERSQRRELVQAEIDDLRDAEPADHHDMEQAVRIRGVGPVPTGTRVLSPLDFVFSLLAVIVAFRLAAGFASDDDDE